jgi:AcrR family transcriptional regulator
MPGIPTPDRRRQRSLLTRNAIRRSALELVAARGLEDVSVEQIVERADVGYRTFFNHFSNKEDALVESGEERAAELLARLQDRPVESRPLETLRDVFLVQAASIEEQEHELSLRFTVIEANPLLMRRFHAEFVAVERALALSVADRLQLDPDVELYPHLLSAVACTALRTSVLRWRAGGGGTQPAGTLVALVARSFDLLAAGFPAPMAEIGGKVVSTSGAA